jgi:hypothetical protein
MLAYRTAHRRRVIIMAASRICLRQEGFRFRKSEGEGTVVDLQQGADDTCLISLGVWTGLD